MLDLICPCNDRQKNKKYAIKRRVGKDSLMVMYFKIKIMLHGQNVK